LVQLNVSLLVAQSKFNPYKRETSAAVKLFARRHLRPFARDYH